MNCCLVRREKQTNWLCDWLTDWLTDFCDVVSFILIEIYGCFESTCWFRFQGRSVSSARKYFGRYNNEIFFSVYAFDISFLFIISITVLHVSTCASDSVFGIATRYGLDILGIEFRCERDFPHASTPALEPTQPPTLWLPGVKRPGRGFDHPQSCIAEVKERVELYLFSPSGPSW